MVFQDNSRDLDRLQAAQVDWLRGCQLSRPGRAEDGALCLYPGQGAVNPYFANFAALALLQDPSSRPLVRRYLEWYLRHLENDGTIRDYDYDTGRTGSPDSADAYAGTFLVLAARYHRWDGEWAPPNLPVLKKIARTIIRLMDSDGLTFALATRNAKKYLMDNCEAYRGLAAFASLLAETGDGRAAFFASRAASIRTGVEKVLWDPCRQAYRPLRSRLARPKWRKFYPDATCQIFPSLYGLIDPSSPRAVHLYRTFNRHQPHWPVLRPPGFPWMILAYWAALQGDAERAREKLLFAQQAYVEARAGAWYCAEAAFFVLTCRLLQGAANFTGA